MFFIVNLNETRAIIGSKSGKGEKLMDEKWQQLKEVDSGKPIYSLLWRCWCFYGEQNSGLSGARTGCIIKV